MSRSSNTQGTTFAVLQWLLLGAALTVSALAFTAAKASFERQGQAAAER